MIKLRHATPADLDFVYATWLRSYRHASSFARKISNTIYYHWHHRIIENAFARGATIKIAALDDAPAVIIGYIVVEGSTAHYVYVKGDFRKMGVAKALLEGHNITQFTHLTDHTEHVLGLVPGAEYNPYLL